MNSPIKLPAIPYSLLEVLSDEAITGVHIYAEQAVREALASAPVADEQLRKSLERLDRSPYRFWKDGGYVSGNVSCADVARLVEYARAALASAPPKENNHEQK